MRAGASTASRIAGPTAQTARLMLYGLLAVVLMAMDHRGQYVSQVRSVLEYAVEPIYHVVEWPARAIRNLQGQFQTRRSLRHENDDLRRQLLGQQADLQRLATLVEENRRLRALFEGADHGAPDDPDLDRVGGLACCGDEPADVLAGVGVDDDADRRHVSARHRSDPGTGDRGADAGLDVVDPGLALRSRAKGVMSRRSW